MTVIFDNTLFKQSFFASGTREVPLFCLELTMGGETVRMVRDFVPLTHNGHEYYAVPDMEVAPPACRRGEVANTVIAFGDADCSRIKVLRSVEGPIPARMFTVLASTPDTIVKGPYDLLWRREEKSGSIIRGTLVQDDSFLTRPASADRYDPQHYRSLF